MYNLQGSRDFRLFMTMEMSQIPRNLVRMCYKIVVEPPSGIKESLLRSFKGLMTEERCNKAPVWRSKVHFLTIWTHSVIIERMKYNPIGWSKYYEFNESDLRCCLDLIDDLVNSQCTF